MDAMRAIPGVNSVGLVDTPPLHLGWNLSYVFSDHGTDLRTPNALAQAIEYRISPEYLQAAKTALLAGQNFNWHDDENAPRAAVINREFAHKIFPVRAVAFACPTADAMSFSELPFRNMVWASPSRQFVR